MTLLFKPMLAYSKTPPLTELKYPVLASPKLDGIRCIMADGVAFTRSMKRVPNLFVQKELQALQLHGLDGELMIEGDFNAVQSAIMRVDGEPDFYLNIFDDFHALGGFNERIAAAEAKVRALNNRRIRLVEHVYCNNEEELQSCWNSWVEQGYEGGMVRAINGPYKRGRSTLLQGYLIKLKNWFDDEGVIVGLEEGKTNENEAFKGELGQTKRSSESHGMVGTDTLGSLILEWRGRKIKVGTGFGLGVPGEDAKLRKKIWEEKEAFIGKTVSFKYQELTHLGNPRFPTFKGFRRD